MCCHDSDKKTKKSIPAKNDLIYLPSETALGYTQIKDLEIV